VEPATVCAGRGKSATLPLTIVDNLPAAASTRPVPALAATHPTIALLQTNSLASVVQGELERMILDGELAPGDKLGEAALAARLGVSRGPLREAFRMLEEAGLVRTAKNRGVQVRDVALQEALEIFELRAAMEALAGRRLAGHIGAAGLKELRSVVDAMEQAAKARDPQRYHAHGLAFHGRLVELAGNAKLTAVYRKLTKELNLFLRRDLDDPRLLPTSAASHRALLKAIASGDPEAAARCLFDHVMDRRQRTLRNHPGAVTPAQQRA
jgi:phosphonate utilization transcriptional regulator